MTDIMSHYFMTGRHNVAGNTWLWLTSHPLDRGIHIFTTTTLSQHRVTNWDIALRSGGPKAEAWIYSWKSYGPDGRIIETIPYTYQSAAWIEDAYTVTYVLEVGGGCAVTSQINVFRR
ncbi:MAG: hypothetical protein ACXWD8_10750 [Mycobacterium sp.]